MPADTPFVGGGVTASAGASETGSGPPASGSGSGASGTSGLSCPGEGGCRDAVPAASPASGGTAEEGGGVSWPGSGAIGMAGSMPATACSVVAGAGAGVILAVSASGGWIGGAGFSNSGTLVTGDSVAGPLATGPWGAWSSLGTRRARATTTMPTRASMVVMILPHRGWYRTPEGSRSSGSSTLVEGRPRRGSSSSSRGLLMRIRMVVGWVIVLNSTGSRSPRYRSGRIRYVGKMVKYLKCCARLQQKN